MINVYLFLYYTIILFPLQLYLHFIVKGLGIRLQVSYKKEKSHKHCVYRTLYLIFNSILFVMCNISFRNIQALLRKSWFCFASDPGSPQLFKLYPRADLANSLSDHCYSSRMRINCWVLRGCVYYLCIINFTYNSLISINLNYM